MTGLIQIEDLHYRPESLISDQPDILRGIDLTIEEGAFIAVVGKNGSGKTTLIKHINGLFLPTQGRVMIDGIDTRQPEHRTRLQSMVGMVFQNPADQIVASTVAEDVAFGLENINLPTTEIRTRVAEQLAAVGLTGEADRPPHLLSGGQIQMVALAGVLAREPRVVLFDEPTSMLDPQARESFLKRMQQLHQQGMTIIYVTHHMEEAVCADQVVVMSEGRIALTGSPEDIFQESYNLYEIPIEMPEAVQFADKFRSLGWRFDSPILTPGALISALLPFTGSPKQRTLNTKTNPNGQDPLITLQNVHYTYLAGSPLAQKALNGADLNIRLGKIAAIAGGNGSGKSTLLQHINGILRPEQGRIQVGEISLESPQTRMKDVIRRVGLVFQNPETQFFEVFVGDEIAYGPKQFGLDGIRERVRLAMSMVGLDFESFKDRRLETLSGGEKRKVALASTLVLDQDVLLFDEPTAGMDPQARGELMCLFQELNNGGKTLVIASHRMEELASVAENLSLMHSGQVIETGYCGPVLANSEAINQAGLIQPLAVQISSALVEKGWPIDVQKTYTPKALFASLEDLIQ